MTNLHDDSPFAHPDSDPIKDVTSKAESKTDGELDLTPLADENREIAPDEPYTSDMILVPVLCDACKLRMYAQEKHIGKWIACPDCGTLSEIRSVDPLQRCLVEIRPDGGYSLVQMTSRNIPNPVIRANVDYRRVDGSLDQDPDILPFYGLNEESEDDLENALDFLLGKNKTPKSQDELKFEALAEEARRKKNAPAENAVEREKRLLVELASYKAQRGRGPLSPRSHPSFPEEPTPCGSPKPHSVPDRSPISAVDGSLSASSPTSTTSHSPTTMFSSETSQTAKSVPETALPLSPSSERKRPPSPASSRPPISADPLTISTDPSIGPRGLALNSRSDPRKSQRPQRRFFEPFFDRHNTRRFLLVWGFGLVAMTLYLILSRFLQAYFDPSNDFKPSMRAFFSLFYIQYLISLFPMVLWGVLLLVNGMTLYSETKEGLNRIRRWIPFRVEFASTYLFWLLLVAWIGTLPGSLLGTAFRLFHIVWAPLGFHLTDSVILAGLSAFFLFPLFFISVDVNNRGFELYHPRVWKSVLTRKAAWLSYYLFATFLGGFLIVAVAGFLFAYDISTRQENVFSLALIYLSASALFCATVSVLIHVWLRLLGCLAWSILKEDRP